MNLSRLADSVLEYSFYALFFLVPMIMTPWNFELFEYNKMMLTYGLTVVIAAAWIAKMIVAKKFLFKRSPFDIPLLIFLISQSLSLLFSIDRHTSLWGYYSRFHGGLLSTITYLTLYFAFVSNFNKAKTLTAIHYTLVSAVLVSFYGILEHFGIDAKYWVQDVKNRVFSTLGQPNWLAAYLLALIPLPLAFLLNKLIIRSNSQKPNYQLLITNYQFHFYLLIFTLVALALFFTKSRSGLYSLIPVTGFFVSFLLLPKIVRLKKKILLPGLFFATAILVVSGIFILGKFNSQLQSVGYIVGTTNDARITPQKLGALGSSSSDIRKIVWRGAVDVFKEYPMFGSGVETFAYSYYQFRPVEHNIVSEWDFLYNKAHNEYLNFLATTGAFGLGSYLLLIGWISVWNLKKISNFKLLISNQIPNPKNQLGQLEIRSIRNLTIALFSGWFSILITNFFGFSVVIVAIFFFLFPAFAVILTRTDAEDELPLKGNSRLDGTQSFLFVAVALVSLYLLFSLIRLWQADVAYATGTKLNRQGEYLTAFNSLRDAVKINSDEPVYHDELAWSAANLAYLLNIQKDTANSQKLTNFAISTSDKALSISPKNMNFYRTRAKIFFKLAQIDSNYLKEAEVTLLKARKLAPTDAKIAYNLGLVQEGLGKSDEAIKTLEETTKLKSNYPDSFYMLASVYKEHGRTKEAITTMDYLVKNIWYGFPDAETKLKEWRGY